MDTTKEMSEREKKRKLRGVATRKERRDTPDLTVTARSAIDSAFHDTCASARSTNKECAALRARGPPGRQLKFTPVMQRDEFGAHGGSLSVPMGTEETMLTVVQRSPASLTMTIIASYVYDVVLIS